MPSKYRQLKEAIGLSSPDSDHGKLARLKDELKSTLADKVEKVQPIDRPTLRDIHRQAYQRVKAKDLTGAQAKMAELKQRLEAPVTSLPKVVRDPDMDKPMLSDLQALKLAATTREHWQQKIAKCEEFLQKYAAYQYPGQETKADYSKECAEAKGILAEGKKLVELDKMQDLSMQAAFAMLKSQQPTTVADWQQKIARCEAFLDHPHLDQRCAGGGLHRA
jgi:hypothetical protein